MGVLWQVFGGLFVAFGLFALAGAKSEGSGRSHPGVVVGGLAYVVGGAGALVLATWWPLIGGFVGAWIAKAILGDPYSKR